MANNYQIVRLDDTLATSEDRIDIESRLVKQVLIVDCASYTNYHSG